MRLASMRKSMALSAVMALPALAACTTAQPTIAYRIVGGDVTEANATNIRALQYCQQEYGRGARLRSYTGNTAIYTCSGTPTVATAPLAPVVPAPSPAPGY
jgi:hypothetical protein